MPDRPLRDDDPIPHGPEDAAYVPEHSEPAPIPRRRRPKDVELPDTPSDHLARTSNPVSPVDFRPDWTVHPGTVWREILDRSPLSQNKAARAIGCSDRSIKRILAGERLPSIELTRKFAELMDVPFRLLWNMQQRWETDVSEGRVERPERTD